jgi:hypothetical protein
MNDDFFFTDNWGLDDFVKEDGSEVSSSSSSSSSTVVSCYNCHNCFQLGSEVSSALRSQSKRAAHASSVTQGKRLLCCFNKDSFKRADLSDACHASCRASQDAPPREHK